jgi:hypothetical protein
MATLGRALLLLYVCVCKCVITNRVGGNTLPSVFRGRHTMVEKIQLRLGTANTKRKPLECEFHITAVSHYIQITFCKTRYFVVGSKILRTQQGRHRNISDELSRVDFRIIVISNQSKTVDIFRYANVLLKEHLHVRFMSHVSVE